MFVEEVKKEWLSSEKTTSGKPKLRKRVSTVYVLKCDNCGGEFSRKTGEMDRRRANNNYRHFCNTCGNANALAADLGRETYRKNLAKKVGERVVDSMGYIMVYVGDTHPYSEGYGGAIREHVVVMENHLGRSLQKGEVVHHIDGDKTNNCIDNLDLCTVSEHNACHGATEALIFDLYKKGLAGYDRESKRYFLKV